MAHLAQLLNALGWKVTIIIEHLCERPKYKQQRLSSSGNKSTSETLSETSFAIYPILNFWKIIIWQNIKKKSISKNKSFGPAPWEVVISSVSGLAKAIWIILKNPVLYQIALMDLLKRLQSKWLWPFEWNFVENMSFSRLNTINIP